MSLTYAQPKAAISLGAVTTFLVFLLSHGAIIAIVRRVRRKAGYEPVEGLYEDCDGVASEESQQRFSTIVPRTFALIASIAGVGVGIATVVVQSRQGNTHVIVDGCLRLACWMFLALQALVTVLERRPTIRFRHGVLAMCSAVLILAQLAVISTLCVRWEEQSSDVTKQLMGLLISQAGLAFIAGVTFVCIPRRPTVFVNDNNPVDEEFTVSVLNRLSFTWALPLLQYARKNKTLTIKDIPHLADYARAETLARTYNESKKEGRRLWLQLVIYLKWPFIKQMVLISVVSFTQFLPQLAMYNLLKLLEKRTLGEAIDSTAWLWVVGLFLSMIVSSWVESFLFWIVMGQLAIPSRNLLSTLVFLKSTVRKDTKGVSASKKAEVDKDLVVDLANGKAGPEVDTAVTPDEKSDVTEEEETMQKSRQNTINLVGVDTIRVADFCAYVYIFPGTVVKLIVSFSFLWKLVGGFPLLAGIVAFSAALPLNVWFSRNYNSLQGDLMKMRDIKMAVVTEALQGIRQIKFSGLEDKWQKQINEKRNNELDVLWGTFKWDTLLISVWIFGPIMLAAALLTTYALIHGELGPSIAFTCISILGSIEMTLAVIPELTTDAVDAWVSLKRIEEYLNAPEKVDCLTKSDVIVFKNVSVAWPADSQEEDKDRFVLGNLNLDFPRGKLSVITGRTGAGKSLLLAALLGEVDKMEGTIQMPRPPPLAERFDHKAVKSDWIIPDGVAFVAQIPWIENATIKDNILFGLPLDQVRYMKVLDVCALRKDLDILEDGDMTDIGANGINLSGGQRWRVSFARALYSRAGILVLDDIFSAVDAHVGRQLFEQALTGDLCKERTRILVTHHVGLCLPQTMYTVKLEEGKVLYAGTVDELRRNGHIDEIMKDDAALKEEKQALEEIEEAEEQDVEDVAPLRAILSRRRSSVLAKIDDSAGAVTKKDAPKVFTEAEGREVGRIKTHVYAEYIRTSGGWRLWIPLTAIFISYWVALWTRSYRVSAKTMSTPLNLNSYHSYYFQGSGTPSNAASDSSIATTVASSELWYYLSIYLALSVASVIFGTLKYFVTYIASLRASHKLFEKMSFVVLRAPLRWLDTVPVGRVLNRFSSDFNQLDSRIAGTLAFLIYRILETAGITATALFVSPLMIVVALVLFILVLLVAMFYLSGAREVKRLESNAKSPVFEQFGSVLAGIGTIRAFDKADEYKTRMYAKIDALARAHWYNWVFNRFMGFWINIIGALFAFIVAIFVVSLKNIDASIAGLALSFALQYTGAIISSVRGYANLEMIMNATERIIEYTGLPTEPQGGTPPPASWPTKGRLEVNNLVAAYAPTLPPVLKGLSFTVEPNERIGVVGRTGAGKSSLTLALFRFIQTREGSVHIDGLDTAQMTLHELRSRLAIIPQDPVLFSGTIRSNLDPFDEHTDEELHDALERVHLVSKSSPSASASVVKSNGASVSADGTNANDPTSHPKENTNIFHSLSSKIAEGGLNLSQGQRQLLCLARAIVSHPKFMVLDEATSAVDMATDVLIQRSIREEFSDCTWLVIAHRLSTIADFDRILVMDAGRAVEYDSPRRLWEKKGVFWEMCCSSGEREELERMVKGDGRG